MEKKRQQREEKLFNAVGERLSTNNKMNNLPSLQFSAWLGETESMFENIEQEIERNPLVLKVSERTNELPTDDWCRFIKHALDILFMCSHYHTYTRRRVVLVGGCWPKMGNRGIVWRGRRRRVTGCFSFN